MTQPTATPALDAKTALLGALAVVTILYLIVLVRGLRQSRAETGVSPAPTPAGLATGFVVNFFDTFGIGSFATTTAVFKRWKMVRDEQIPGTLNIGHTLPTIAQAFIYTKLVPVEASTLISLIIAAVVGAWLGAGVVSKWPRQRIQMGMGLALLGAAAFMAAKATGFLPAGSDALGLSGTKLILGIVGNFALGALMTIGIGLYGPCMILVGLLGMNATTAFPIMMGSCAFLMPTASAKFIKERKFDAKAVIAMAIGGVPAVLIAALIVKSMSIAVVQWLVVVVVLYTAVTMLRSALSEMPAAAGEPVAKPTA
jgi:uncharacterized membrane protein YfcA